MNTTLALVWVLWFNGPDDTYYLEVGRYETRASCQAMGHTYTQQLRVKLGLGASARPKSESEVRQALRLPPAVLPKKGKRVITYMCWPVRVLTK